MKPKVITRPSERGILTSSYKEEIKKSIRDAKVKSISEIKSLIFNHQAKIESQTGTVLRVSFFAIALIFMAL
jgi:hypothetical protein|tara:strand:- start:32 stop:247 length:216 start_codon:yes stop_codon:yes gene_type:complete